MIGGAPCGGIGANPHSDMYGARLAKLPPRIGGA